MRRREGPIPEAPTPGRTRELVRQIAAVHAQGDWVSHHRDSSHYHPAAEELIDLPPAVGYRLARRMTDPRPITPMEIDAMVTPLWVSTKDVDDLTHF